MEMYQKRDLAGAINAFIIKFVVPDPDIVERALPGAINRAIAEADTFFKIELPALQLWSFTAEDAKLIKQPVLSVLAQESYPIFKEIDKIVRAWFPQSKTTVFPKATHGFPFQNPRGLAEALSGFFARYPMQ